MILKCKNKTESTLVIGDVSIDPSASAFVFYNRKFFKHGALISQLLGDGSIEFSDEYGDLIAINSQTINGDLKELVDSMEMLGNSFSPDVKYTNSIEQIIGSQILSIIKIMFLKANPAGYNQRDLAVALDGAHIPTLLTMGSIKAAANAINGIATDAFFTNARKAKLVEICNSVDL